MNFKRIFSALVCAAMLAGFTACEKEQEPVDNNKQNDQNGNTEKPVFKSISIATESGDTAQIQEIEDNSSLQFKATIENAAASVAFKDSVRWHCTGKHISIDEKTGLVKANMKTYIIERDDSIWATVTYPETGEIITVKSNVIICRVVNAQIDINFTPVSVTSTYDDYGMEVPMFVDADGNQLLFLPNTGFLAFYEPGVYNSDEGDGDNSITLTEDGFYNLTYRPVSGTEYKFDSGTCSLTIADGQATYTFSDVKAINGGGTGVDVYLTVTPASGTLPFEP